MTKILLLSISLALCGSAAAQSPKASEQSKSKPAKQNHGRVFQSHSKIVGGFGRYQVHSLRIRGLDSPNVSAAVIYDPLTESYTVVGPATGAGLGSAILGAAGNVGSSAVFGMSLRPDRHNENINNGSTSEGGEATSVSVSDADSTATNTSTNTNNRKNGNGPKPKKPKKN